MTLKRLGTTRLRDGIMEWDYAQAMDFIPGCFQFALLNRHSKLLKLDL